MKLILFWCLTLVLCFPGQRVVYAGPVAPVLRPVVKQGLKAGEKVLGKEGAYLAKKGTKECIGGDSTKLAKALGITPKSGYQAHHIIPVECKSHRTLNKIGFDLDQPKNGIALPSRPGLSKDLPVHNGYHSSYSNAVKRDLDAIPADLSEAETAKRVNAVIRKYRKMIESGKPLYDTGAPNAWK